MHWTPLSSSPSPFLHIHVPPSCMIQTSHLSRSLCAFSFPRFSLVVVGPTAIVLHDAQCHNYCVIFSWYMVIEFWGYCWIRCLAWKLQKWLLTCLYPKLTIDPSLLTPYWSTRTSPVPHQLPSPLFHWPDLNSPVWPSSGGEKPTLVDLWTVNSCCPPSFPSYLHPSFPFLLLCLPPPTSA